MRSRARHAIAAVVAIALGGCGATDPCRGKAGACVAVHVTGSAPTLDELQIAVTTSDGGTLRGDSGLTAPRITLPVQFALRLPAGTRGGLTIDVAGLQGDAAVAAGTSSIDLPASGRGSVDVVLRSIGGDGGGGAGDGGTGDGGGGGGPVTLTPNPLDFGSIEPNMTSTKTLTLTNHDAPVTIAGITLSGASGFARAGSGSCQEQQTLDSGDSCTIDVVFLGDNMPGIAAGHVDVGFGAGAGVGADLRAHTRGWVSESSPLQTPPDFYTVWGTAPDDVWAGGSLGSLYHRDATGKWSAAISGTPLWPADAHVHVFTPAPGDVYVAAKGLYHSADGGKTWKRLADYFATDSAVEVYGSSATTIFAGSDTGRLERGSAGGGFVLDGTTGATLIDQLFGVDQQAYAVEGNTIFQRGVASWDPVLDETANAVLEGGFAVAAGDFYVAARLTSATCSPRCAAIYHVSPMQATTVTALDGTQLNAVWGNDATELWAVGKTGVAYHTAGGNNWLPESMPVNTDLNAAWGSGDDLFVVGAGGVILHHY